MKDFIKYTLATLFGLTLYGIFAFFLTFMCFGVLLALEEEPTTVLTQHSVYCLDLDGNVVEHSDVDEVEELINTLYGFEDSEYGLEDILANIKRASEEADIDGIYLKGGSMSMGIATAQQIRAALEEFKSSGKFVVAYADGYGQLNYYLASVADYVMLNPEGSVAWDGLSATTEFYTRLLEKIGVEMQVVKVGTFKSAVEPFMLTEMSEANRLQTEVYVKDIWSELKQSVSASRGLSETRLDYLADQFMSCQPQQAYVSTGLVDTLCYLQDVEAVLTRFIGSSDYTLVSHSEMCALPDKQKKHADKIAVVYAEGDIVDQAADYSMEDMIVGDDYVDIFNELAEDDDVKAVVLRVNSGGGSAYASEQMNHAITLLKKQKPVVVTMGDYAASGGYYMSTCADYIYAMPTTITGSIGIFGLIPSYGKLANKIGIDFDGVKTNRHSDLETNAVLYGMNDEERAIMQAEINRGYDLFTRRCAEGRHVSQDYIKTIAEGRVWTGNAAQKLGLVDALGGMDEAIAKAAELAHLEPSSYSLTTYPEAEDWVTKLLDEATGVSDRRVAAKLEQVMGHEAYQTYQYFTTSASDGRHLHARMPYSVRIR